MQAWPLVFLLLLPCAGCNQIYFPPPAQRTPISPPIEMMLDMTPGRPRELWGSIVSGPHSAGDPNADWRWTSAKSVFTFNLEDFEGWSLSAHLTAAKAVLDQRGAQKIAFAVNGTEVGAAEFRTPGRYDLLFPLTPELLKRESPVRVTMTAGPCLPSGIGPEYCVLLHSIGFKEGQP